MTRSQAQLLWNAFELGPVLASEEEVGLLEEHNPELLQAYFALHRLGFGVDENCAVENIANGPEETK